MHAPDDNTTPSRFAMWRLVSPWERRHLHEAVAIRSAGGGFQLGVGLVLLSLGQKAETDQGRRKCYGWSAWFLANAALQFLGVYMDLKVARSAEEFELSWMVTPWMPGGNHPRSREPSPARTS